MSKTDEISNQLKKMEYQMKDTVDINYKKYNDVFMEKVAEHNQELRKEKAASSDREIERRTKEGAKYLHNKSKGRIIYI